MKSFLILSTILFFSLTAKAQINFNQLTYSGSGCPQGTVSSVTSPDGSALSLFFDELKAEVPQYDGQNDNQETRGRGPRTRDNSLISHKACKLSFTATLPPGMKVDGVEISLQARGATNFDSGVSGYFGATLINVQGMASSGGRTAVISRKIWGGQAGEVNDDWEANSTKQVPLSSGCSGAQGRTIRFDLVNHVNAEIINGDVSKHGLITVDSNDMTGLLTFSLRTRVCAGDRMPPIRR